MQAWEEKAMEREAGRKEGYESGQKEGYESGHESGQQEGKEQMSKLILLLLKEKRSEELERVAKDPEYCRKLIEEHGLEKNKVIIDWALHFALPLLQDYEITNGKKDDIFFIVTGKKLIVQIT